MVFESPAPRKRRRFRLPSWAELILMALGAFLLFIAGVSIIWAMVVPIPSIDNFQNRAVAQSTKIYDRTSNVMLYDVHGSVRRTVVPLENISPFIQKATIAIEDETFYTHHGFRPLAFLRAVLVNMGLREGYHGQGGSTITQQVIKNALLTRDKTLMRKAEEIILALRLEKIYSKEQILSAYLNENPYGGTIYGVEEASQYFFGIPAKDVDLAQAAYLAALPQAPTYYSPHGNHRDALDARKNLVLDRLLEQGLISAAEHDEARAEIVEFRKELEAGIKAPHFVFYIREYLEQKYGADVVQNEGLRVITTLDYDLQEKAEQIVERAAKSNEVRFNASNAALVAIDPKTGQILTMVGSRDYFDPDIDGMVNVAVAHRQPGSSFKPFVYATAFERGYTPETVVFDLKTQFSTSCSADDPSSEPPCYSPQNYDHAFAGPITLRNALAQSKNIPAVKTLYLAGIKDSIATAEKMGITTLTDPNRYGLTLVLGGGEVTLLDMTSAYGVFANDGVRNPPVGILRVEDRNGVVLENYEDKSERVMDPQIARQISDVLSDNVARTPLYGATSPLLFPGHDVAAKTGTTNDNIDAWVLGYSTGIVAGAWAGNNTPEPMNQISGLIVTPLWHEFLAYAMEKYPGEAFPAPAPDPSEDTLPPVLRGNWNTDPSRGVHDILFWVQKDDPRAGVPNNPYADPQFERWDWPVRMWTLGITASSTPSNGAGSTPDAFHIITPVEGAALSATQPILLTAGGADIRSVTYYVGGAAVGSSNQPPFAFTTVPSVRGPSLIRAVAQTESGGVVEHSIHVLVQ